MNKYNYSFTIYIEEVKSDKLRTGCKKVIIYLLNTLTLRLATVLL